MNKNNIQIKIMYILHGTGGGGGAHSVVQECLQMHRFGVKAQIAVKKSKLDKFLETYREIPEIKEILLPYVKIHELKQLAKQFSVVCATIYTSVQTLKELTLEGYSFLPAYYIQDYEPLFAAKDSPEWEEAMQSYTLLPNTVMFAKTKWLCEVVGKNHNVTVYKVEPSIDHEVYYPSLQSDRDCLELSCMVRFSTKRRAPRRTLRVLKRLSEMFPKKVHFTIFGSDRTEIETEGMTFPENVQALGHITRPEVAAVLRNSDIFLELSDYQAFGRTALEAMASGCIPVVPERGGTSEFAVPCVNSLVIDTTSEAECVGKISELIEANPEILFQIKLNALETASRYSTKRAASSILSLFYHKLLQLKNP